MQYGKLISYWNCKITNTSDPRAVQCDCEKILTDTNGDEDSNVLANVLSTKTEEWHNTYASVIVPAKHLSPGENIISKIISYPTRGYAGSIFQPPKIS